MPHTSKFYGNIAGLPVGSPDDPPHEGEFFPSGDYCDGYMRRSLPSEYWLDNMIFAPLAEREGGYMPPPPEPLVKAETANRALRRSFRITEGNATGQFTGPPDRVRKQRTPTEE